MGRGGVKITTPQKKTTFNKPSLIRVKTVYLLCVVELSFSYECEQHVRVAELLIFLNLNTAFKSRGIFRT